MPCCRGWWLLVIVHLSLSSSVMWSSKNQETIQYVTIMMVEFSFSESPWLSRMVPCSSSKNHSYDCFGSLSLVGKWGTRTRSGEERERERANWGETEELGGHAMCNVQWENGQWTLGRGCGVQCCVSGSTLACRVDGGWIGIWREPASSSLNWCVTKEAKRLEYLQRQKKRAGGSWLHQCLLMYYALLQSGATPP